MEVGHRIKMEIEGEQFGFVGGKGTHNAISDKRNSKCTKRLIYMLHYENFRRFRYWQQRCIIK